MPWGEAVAWAAVSVQLVFSLLMGYSVLLLRVAHKLDPKQVEAEADEKFNREQERRARREKLEDMGESTGVVDQEEEAEREAESKRSKYIVWPLKRPALPADTAATSDLDLADPKQAQSRALAQHRRHIKYLRFVFWARVGQYLAVRSRCSPPAPLDPLALRPAARRGLLTRVLCSVLRGPQASLFFLLFVIIVRVRLEQEGLCDLTDGVAVDEDAAAALSAASADLQPLLAHCFFGIRGQLFLSLTLQGLVLPFIFRIPSYCHSLANVVFFFLYCAILLPLSDQPLAGMASSGFAFLLWMLTVHCVLLIDERNRRLAFRESRIAAFHRASQEVFVSHLTHELRNPVRSREPRRLMPITAVS